MRKLVLLSLLAIFCNALPALAQTEYSPQCKMNFGKGEVYTIEVGAVEDQESDTSWSCCHYIAEERQREIAL